MTSSELRSIQAPLKEKYRNQPESALITLKAIGVIGEGLSCNVVASHANIDTGPHPAIGGDGLLACAGDLLLQALASCAGVTLASVSTAIGIDLGNSRIEAEGEIDFKGTLGVSKEVPVGFKSIRLNFYFDSKITPEQTATLAKLTERYCVIYQTITNGLSIETSYNHS
jgi:uncharacterized OsmC-like protein